METVVSIIALLLWAVVDYKAAKMVRDKNEGFEVVPELYALGAIIFGGIWPLLWLAGKYLLWKK